MFGETVRAQRRRLGLTQEELADRTGVSVRTIRDIEICRTHNPRQCTVRLLADAFGLTDDDREHFVRSALPVRDPASAPSARRISMVMAISTAGTTVLTVVISG